jgi:K+-sensing histidine kinase KdpD
MEWVRTNRGAVAVAAGLLLPLAVAGLMAPFRETFADAAAAVVLVALVAGIAIGGSRAAGYAAAVSSAVWFDFFLTRPYDQFTITHRTDIEITVSLLVVGVVVTEMAARSRHHRQVAVEGHDYVKLLYEVSELASSGVGINGLVSRVSHDLIRLLHLRDCSFEAGAAFERTAIIGHDAGVRIGTVEWPAQQWGLPGQQIALMVYSGGRTVGRFVMTPTVGEPVDLLPRLVAVALADQVGSMLRPQLRAG